MNKTPYMYNDIQLKEIEEYIEDNFGSQFPCLVHEIVSAYVHTDTFLIKTKEGQSAFVTCGMGAREMNTPNNFKRCELVMQAGKDFVPTSEQALILAGELVRISKFPFREKTWLGTGHTMDASEKFKETFGFDYFAFVKLPLSTKLTGMKNDINFLMAVPIYEEERQWCVNNHTLAFLDKLNEKYNGKQLCADFKRDVFIPNDLDECEFIDYDMMTTLGIDRETLKRLSDYLEELEEMGEDITYDTVENWLIENK